MILIDLSRTMVAGLMVQLAGQKNTHLDENLIRHMVLNIIRSHVKMFKREYGEIVLCCDSKKYWRKEYFPYYKAKRKATRDASDLDWQQVFVILNAIREELKKYFPYKVIEIEGAEADDIIGVLAPMKSKEEPVLIIATDGDFLQLQQHGNIKQYNPTQKKYLTSKEPLLELKEKIIRGDRGDGIPNILSPGDTFVRDIRQKVMTEDRFTKFMSTHQNLYDETARTGYTRNEVLIDLSLIPQDIKTSILDTYNNTKPASRSRLLTYFMEKKLKNLMEDIGDF
jgi:5'-3' exonuclease